MLRRIRFDHLRHLRAKLFYCTSPTEQQQQPPKINQTSNTQLKPDETESKSKIIRPFSKDMLINRFNLDLFTYPEVQSTSQVEKVFKICSQLKSLMCLLKDSQDEASRDNLLRLLSHSGILGLCMPEKYEGSGYDSMMFGRVVEELSDHMEYMLDVLNPQFLASQAIMLGGSDLQRERWIPAMAKGEMRAAIALQDRPCDGIGLENMRSTATLDEHNGVYLLNGRLERVTGFNGAHYLVVFARTSERQLSTFLVPVDTEGIQCEANNDNGCVDIVLDNALVSVDNRLTNDEVSDGIQLIRQVATVNNIVIATICSGIAKSLIEQTNQFVSERNIFGQPLSQTELVETHMAHFVKDVYETESVAFYSAGLVDGLPANDLYIESCLAKIGNMNALRHCVDATIGLMGTAAASADNGAIKRLFDNIRLLQRYQISSSESRQAVLKETIEYLRTNLKIQPMTTVLGDKIVGNSISYNLHPRLAELTKWIHHDLDKLMKFLVLASWDKDKNLLDEGIVHNRLSVIMTHLYSIVAVLSRASRSISIGLRNHDHEINIAELHYTDRMQKIRTEINELNKISADIESINECAKMIKEMGGYFVTEGFSNK